MPIPNVKPKANSFLKEFDIGTVSSQTLEDALEQLGYTVVPFNSVVNDEDIDSLIRALKVEDLIARQRGFTYADANRRIVFVCESLTETEKTIVLAHEAGHIYCGHMDNKSILGKDVSEEYEANEFAHYLLHPSFAFRSKQWLGGHKRAVIFGATGLVLLAAVLFAFIKGWQGTEYYGEYYITESGNKYHTADCIYIKNKTNVRRLTKEEFESGDYKPCGRCITDEVAEK